jgi:hypothetical protein
LGTSRAEGEELTSLFLAAAHGGNMSSLFERLAPDVLLFGDSGGLGEVTLIAPVAGRDRVAQVVRAQLARTMELGASLRAAWVNGQPGLLATDADGGLIAVIALDVLGGQVQAIRTVANRRNSATSAPSPGPGTCAGARKTKSANRCHTPAGGGVLEGKTGKDEPKRSHHASLRRRRHRSGRPAARLGPDRGRP